MNSKWICVVGSVFFAYVEVRHSNSLTGKEHLSIEKVIVVEKQRKPKIKQRVKMENI